MTFVHSRGLADRCKGPSHTAWDLAFHRTALVGVDFSEQLNFVLPSTRSMAAMCMAVLDHTYSTRFTAGTFHVRSRSDGGDSFGQYSLIISLKVSAGAGSQFDSLPLSGESC